jgi:hypothetical protein
MKWCRFQIGSHTSHGIVEDDRVIEVSGIHEMSQTATLHPGDVLWMGTQGADGDMVPGDVIEVEISGIGTLRNYVAAEK